MENNLHENPNDNYKELGKLNDNIMNRQQNNKTNDRPLRKEKEYEGLISDNIMKKSMEIKMNIFCDSPIKKMSGDRFIANRKQSNLQVALSHAHSGHPHNQPDENNTNILKKV